MVERGRYPFYSITRDKRQQRQNKKVAFVGHYWWNEHGFGDFKRVTMQILFRFPLCKKTAWPCKIKYTYLSFLPGLRVLSPNHTRPMNVAWRAWLGEHTVTMWTSKTLMKGPIHLEQFGSTCLTITYLWSPDNRMADKAEIQRETGCTV